MVDIVLRQVKGIFKDVLMQINKVTTFSINIARFKTAKA